jgi:hypothetical protein
MWGTDEKVKEMKRTMAERMRSLEQQPCSGSMSILSKVSLSVSLSVYVSL